MRFKVVIALLLLVLVAALDFMLPLGIAGGVLYLLVILVSLWFEKPRYALWLAGISTALIVTDWVLSPGGSEMWKVALNRLFSIAGVWVAAIAFFHFIRSKQRWRDIEKYAIFDKMWEGVQVIDPQWRYHYVNDAVASQAGTTTKGLLGYTMMEKYPGIEKTELFGYISRCMNERVPHRMANRFEVLGSENYFDLSIQPVPEGVLILSVDVTRQQQMEARLRQLNRQLEGSAVQRSKELAVALNREKKINEHRTSFISKASHELKTPLAAIQVNLSVLENFNAPEYVEERKFYIGSARSTVESMFETLSDFLSLEKIDQGYAYAERQKFDLSGFIASELEKMKPACKERQAILYHHMGSDEVITDKRILRSILSNLVSNAVKYSGKDIDVLSQADAKNVMLQVADQGIGIPAGEQKHMFQKFFRASNTNGIPGTGLGLIIVKKYVELLNGTIHFESDEQKGTLFQVCFPNTAGNSRIINSAA